jgi:hypothetical protein
MYLENNNQALECRNEEFETLGRDSHAPKSILKSWIISFNQIKEINPRAEDILSMISFYHWQAIPVSLLKNDDETTKSIKEAIGKLVTYSLVTRNTSYQQINIHRLAPLVSRGWLKVCGDDRIPAAISQGGVLEQFPEEEYRDWDICEAYLPHARAIILDELSQNSEDYNEPVNSLIRLVGVYLCHRGLYAGEILRVNIEYLSRQLGPEDPATWTVSTT